MKSPTNTPSAGYISATEVYTLSACKRRLGMGRHSFALLRRAGLPTLKVGRNCYVRGGDILNAIEVAAAKQACDQKDAGAE